MHPVVYLNKNMVEASKARVAPVSAALLYGRGVFTSVAIYGGRPFLWPEHWARLMDHADRARVMFSVSWKCLFRTSSSPYEKPHRKNRLVTRAKARR